MLVVFSFIFLYIQKTNTSQFSQPFASLGWSHVQPLFALGMSTDVLCSGSGVPM